MTIRKGTNNNNDLPFHKGSTRTPQLQNSGMTMMLWDETTMMHAVTGCVPDVLAMTFGCKLRFQTQWARELKP
jgi:hypothetical protein